MLARYLQISEPAPSPEYRYLQLKHEKRAYEKQQEELEMAYNDAADQSAAQAQTIATLEVRVYILPVHRTRGQHLHASIHVDLCDAGAAVVRFPTPRHSAGGRLWNVIPGR